MKIEKGIGWVGERSATVGEYVYEIERLRAALREIAEGYIDSGGNRRDLENSCARAREALGETDE